MDDLTTLRQTVCRLIEDDAHEEPSVGGIEVETIFDESKDHYELIYSGRDGHRRIHGPVLHLDIRDGKIWIQHDGTYNGIANSLVEAGVPRDRIVLAFKPPDVRKYTDFAVS